MIELSPNTRVVVGKLFSPENQSDAESFLVHECANNLPFCEDCTPEKMERVRFAALKVSGGSLERLCDAIELAQTDWRDLLVGSGFADDVLAHEEWGRETCQQSPGE